jgi:Phosphopantetheine attachment site.
MNVKDVILKELRKFSNKEISDDSNIKDLNIDSLDLLQLVVTLEKNMQISISDEELLSIKTVKDIINIINKKKN